MPLATFTDEPTSCAAALPTPEILDRNWQTTGAITLAVASGGVTGALMLSVFPAQTLATGATIGGLAYAGKRRHEGKSVIPDWAKRGSKSDDKTDTKAEAKTEVKSEPKTEEKVEAVSDEKSDKA